MARGLLHCFRIKYLMSEGISLCHRLIQQQDNQAYTMSFTDMLIMVVVILLISLVLLLIIHSSCPAWQTMTSGASRVDTP